MLTLGTADPLIPLTREAFGEDGARVIRGWVSLYMYGERGPRGLCLQDENRRDVFVHPVLFDLFYKGAKKEDVHARITLGPGGRLYIQRWNPGTGEAEGPIDSVEPAWAPPGTVFMRPNHILWDRLRAFLEVKRDDGTLTADAHRAMLERCTNVLFDQNAGMQLVRLVIFDRSNDLWQEFREYVRL